MRRSYIPTGLVLQALSGIPVLHGGYGYVKSVVLSDQPSSGVHSTATSKCPGRPVPPGWVAEVLQDSPRKSALAMSMVPPPSLSAALGVSSFERSCNFLVNARHVASRLLIEKHSYFFQLTSLSSEDECGYRYHSEIRMRGK